MKLFEVTDEDGIWVGCHDFKSDPWSIEAHYDLLAGEELALFTRVCAGLPCPQKYITKHAKKYGWNDYLLKEATFFTPPPLPRPVPYYTLHWKCFETSFAYAKKHGLKYIEGLAINPAGAMIHAWCSTDGKDVLDYTWPYQHVNKYFGIEFEIEWLINKGYPQGAILGFLEEETKNRLKARCA